MKKCCKKWNDRWHNKKLKFDHIALKYCPECGSELENCCTKWKAGCVNIIFDEGSTIIYNVGSLNFCPNYGTSLQQEICKCAEFQKECQNPIVPISVKCAGKHRWLKFLRRLIMEINQKIQIKVTSCQRCNKPFDDRLFFMENGKIANIFSLCYKGDFYVVCRDCYNAWEHIMVPIIGKFLGKE